MNRQRRNTDLPLRDSHPQLFKSLLVKGLFMLGCGGLMLTGYANYLIEETVLRRGGQEPLIPITFWGIVFLLVSGMLIYGITNGVGRYKWARRGMVGAASICGVFALGYWFAFLGGYTDRALAPLVWSMLTALFIIWAGEPAFNPLSSALNYNGKAGELKADEREE